MYRARWSLLSYLRAVYTVAMQKNIDADAQRHSSDGQHIAPRSMGDRDPAPVHPAHGRKYGLEPLLLLFAMLAATIFLDAVLPLGGLWFSSTVIGHPDSWQFLPARFLFRGVAFSSFITSLKPTAPNVGLSWRQVPLLLLSFLLVFCVYLLSVWRLPRLINKGAIGYIFFSTALLGLLYVLFPMITSPDLYSYIAYARMGVIYHLNPLTTLPTAIAADPVYVHLYWNTQPSAYGPTWAAISTFLQWLTLPFGRQALQPMVIALRLSGLAAHLCSTLLIWSIIGQIQRRQGQSSPAKRAAATLAFAWNPLVIFEACVNAHNDAQLLLLILLAIWFLLPRMHPTSSLLAAMVILALATCLKLNVVVLVPLVLIFVWKSAQGRHPSGPVTAPAGPVTAPAGPVTATAGLVTATAGLVTATAGLVTATAGLVYSAVVLLLYAPFWQHGEILDIFSTNPSTFRNINSPAYFFSHFYNSLVHPLAPAIGSPAETFAHKLSIGVFMVSYAWLCWRAIHGRERLNTLFSLIRWLSIAWFLYCLVGTPWYWQWYLVTFFGLYALIAGTSGVKELRLLVPSASLLAFSMLSIYCFYAWGPQASYIPGLPHFHWAYLSGLWAWLLPLLALVGPLVPRSRQKPLPG
jgi:hypothetical protein